MSTTPETPASGEDAKPPEETPAAAEATAADATTADSAHATETVTAEEQVEVKPAEGEPAAAAAAGAAAATAPPNPRDKKAVKHGAAHEAYELAKTIVFALLIALFLRVIFFQPFTIPSASMEPTLLEGDYIIVSKYAYGWSRHSIPFSPPIFKGRVAGRTPERGDIVVFKLPRDGRTDYIKRLVGVPGDRVQVKMGHLTINGEPVARTKLKSEMTESAFGIPREVERFQNTMGGRSFVTYLNDPEGEVENTEVYTVPEGQFFMMGDNRDNSVDSRFPPEIGVGFVPAENLVGRAEVILFSWQPGAHIFKPWTWFTDIRGNRFFKRLQ